MEKSAIQWMVTPLQKYADFSGRARRAEYWWYTLFSTLVSIALTVVDTTVLGSGGAAGGIGVLSGLWSLALLIPSLAVSVRRLHDKDKSGWWLLIGLVPIVGAIVLLVWFCTRGTEGPNQFGPDPLGGEHLAQVFS